ncbi:MAG: cell division protein FtsL [Gammaproteobacteria bacterium]|nr:cell division protein FtsL [Gammaproteobacteria bacterium]NND54873.1 cell division protein FtsL [Gammaproteobacteria bacterium]
MTGQARYTAAAAVLAIFALLSAVLSVYARHESRKQFAELQQLTAERDELEVEWGKLQLEQSTQSNLSHVEELARKRIGMRTPDMTEVEVVIQ